MILTDKCYAQMKQKLLILFFSVGVLYSCSDKQTGFQSTTIDLPEVPDLSNGITLCVDGFAGPYPCHDYDLMTLIRRETLLGPLPTQEFAYIWGWVDPTTQKEYALVGSTRGVLFIDVTDPVSPVYIGLMPSFNQSHHRQIIRTFGNYAYMVSESNDYGMRVFDLTRLHSVDLNQVPVNFTADTHYSAFGSAGRIDINEDKGYAYVVGTLTHNGGPHFIDITSPLVPLPAGGHNDDGLTRSVQVVTYNGPDPDYQGKEILIGCNEGKVVIVDVTNKNNPTTISTIEYGDAGYPIEGRFTQNKRYFILGDFWDEIGSGGLSTRTIMLDFQDLDDPKIHAYYAGPTQASDFGVELSKNTLYVANLSAGVRMVSLSTIEDFYLEEIGYFDTYLENDDAIGYIGATNTYPHLPSGNILVNDIYGIFIIRKQR